MELGIQKSASHLRSLVSCLSASDRNFTSLLASVSHMSHMSLICTSLNWFKTGFSANILKSWIGKSIDIPLSFKTSPRMLIYIKNWHSYKNILVHLLFLREFYSFYHIFACCHGKWDVSGSSGHSPLGPQWKQPRALRIASHSASERDREGTGAVGWCVARGEPTFSTTIEFQVEDIRPMRLSTFKLA
jgi:hypothetical protein